MAEMEVPKELVEALLRIGKVEWGATKPLTDEQHLSNFEKTLAETRATFGYADEVEMNLVTAVGSELIVAQTGTSPNSANHARIMVGAWNCLVELWGEGQ